MNLDNIFTSDRLKRIGYCNGSMRVGSRIDQYSIGVSLTMDFIDKFPFDIALKKRKIYFWEKFAQGLQIAIERNPSVELRLPCTDQVQIWPINDTHMHNRD